MSKFTPGPWGHMGNGLISAGEFTYVAQIKGARFTDKDIGAPRQEQADANATLIAAAPDLYAALKAIADLDDGDKPYFWHFEHEFADARAALAKADGK